MESKPRTRHLRNAILVFPLLVLAASFFFYMHTVMSSVEESYTLKEGETMNKKVAEEILSATTYDWKLVEYDDTSLGWIFTVTGPKGGNLRYLLYSQKGNTWFLEGHLERK